jgi:hypothetical protein
MSAIETGAEFGIPPEVIAARISFRILSRAAISEFSVSPRFIY